MKRGQLYRVYKAPGSDPKSFRVFAVVSRQVLLTSRFSTAICAPVYSAYHGLSTQVPLGTDNGLKHESSIHCDELVSIPKHMLSDFMGSLSPAQMNKLDQALAIALDLDKTS